MEQVDQGNQRIADAKQPEIVVFHIPASVPGKNEKGKGDCNGGDLDQAMEQEVTVETAEVKPQNDGCDSADIGDSFVPATVGHFDLLCHRISFHVLYLFLQRHYLQYPADEQPG